MMTRRLGRCCGILCTIVLLAGCGQAVTPTFAPTAAPFVGGAGAATPPVQATATLRVAGTAPATATAIRAATPTLAATTVRTIAATATRAATPTVAASPSAGASAAPEGAWLDTQPIANWNVRGATLPVAAKPSSAPAKGGGPDCNAKPITPANPEQVAVSGAGWTLYREDTRQADVAVVWGLDGYDGMCRPLQYQGFVFVDGVFAGTVSPVLMNSRSDGAAVRSEIASDGRQLVVGYVRYAKSDPLCCPSRTSTLTLAVDFAAKLVVPGNVDTTANATPVPPSPRATPTR